MSYGLERVADPLRITGGFGANKCQKDYTFSNTAGGAYAMFTVTGDVIVRIAAVCTTSITSAAGANIELGIAGATTVIIAQTLSTNLVAREIWHDATPDSEIENMSQTTVMSDHFISDGNDIILTLSAQVDTGALSFYAFWTPLSSDGNVIPA